jgi:hypothetical protein
MLWWKKEATLVSLPFDIAKAPVAGATPLAADAEPPTADGQMERCWYYSERPGDPFLGASKSSASAIPLDYFFREMTEGKHKETLKGLRDTWISHSAAVAGGLAGKWGGAVAVGTLAAVSAGAVACTFFSGTSGMQACVETTKKALQALVAGQKLNGASAVTSAVLAAGGLGAAVGSSVGASAGVVAGRDAGQNFTLPEFNSKMTTLLAASERDRKKLGWEELQALAEIVIEAPQGQKKCAAPWELNKELVAQFTQEQAPAR